MELYELIKRYESLSEKEILLPFKISPFYKKKAEEEISKIGLEGPLFRTAYPTEERLFSHAPFEVPDFVKDKKNMPIGLEHILIQKYENRVLIISTNECAGHCQYCFRTRLLSEEKNNLTRGALTDKNVSKIIEYLKSKPKINEVIFSGGDPLMIPFENLSSAIKRITQESPVRNVRIHTRAIIYAPQIFTDQKIDFFKTYSVRLVFHINHPYEIFPEVEQKIKKMNESGLKIYNQFPILRKINDHPVVIKKLLEQLDFLGVRTLSIFIPDPINFSASFRIPLKRIFSIIDEINWHSPSWVNSVRLVLDSSIGKVRRENITKWEETNNKVTFTRDGHNIVYHDFPEEMDQPGKLKYLLWKEYYEK